MHITSLFAETYQAITFNRADKITFESMNKLQIGNTTIPNIKQDVLRGNLFDLNCIPDHCSKMVVFCFASVLRIVNTVVNRIIVITIGMVNKIDNADTAHKTMLISAILQLYTLNLRRVAFILDAIINNHVRIAAIPNKGANELPQVTRRKMLTLQKIGNLVVAYLLKMFRKMLTRVAERRTD